jgi:hypothetical protein
MQNTKCSFVMCWLWSYPQARGLDSFWLTPPVEGAEKGGATNQNVPQGLKPHCKQSTSGTAKAVPLSKTDFFLRYAARKSANGFGRNDGFLIFGGGAAGRTKATARAKAATDRLRVYIPTHRKKRDGWGTRAVSAG